MDLNITGAAQHNINMESDDSAEVNELILELLAKCNCSQYAKYFKGISKLDFRRMTLEDIKNHFLSYNLEENQVDEFADATLKIYEELQRFASVKRVNQNESQPSASTSELNVDVKPSTTVELQIQSEIKTESKSKSSDEDANSDRDEDDIPLLNNSTKPIEEVALDSSSSDEEIENEVENNPPATEVPDPASLNVDRRPKRAAALAAVSKYSAKTSDFDDDESDDAADADENYESSRRKKSKLGDDDSTEEEAQVNFVDVIDPSTHLKKLKRQGRDYAEESCTRIRLRREVGFPMHHNCSSDPPPDEIAEWIDFFKKFGPTIFSIELYVWSWKPEKSKCPFNLFKMLEKYCPKMEEIIFKVGLDRSETQDLRKFNKVKFSKHLTNLKKIIVDLVDQGQGHGLTPVLQKILKASPNIAEFRYKFEAKTDAEEILGTLGSFDDVGLDKLHIMEVRTAKTDGYLANSEITKLSQVKAKNLREIILGNGIWEDVDGPLMSTLLQNFAHLRKLVIYGNYQGNSLYKPDVTVEIPASTYLEHLEIGGNYEFASVIEKPQRNGSSSREGFNGPGQIFTVEDELKTELFSVTLKLNLLPNLKRIILGNLFKIDELHFSSIPQVVVFRVGSPWHLSVKFPPETARRNCYPLLREMQIPDCLKDESFVQNLPGRFPNLEKCWVFLPSVKVLRAFFKSLGNSKLKTLILKTQFDFESTLEMCLLGRPASTHGACRSWRDMRMWEELRKYGKWEEFVGFYNIELPVEKREELRELEETESFAGLANLKSLEIFLMEHVPRVLRIPKGREHWLGPKAEFSEYMIGYEKYPLSKYCIDQLPRGVKKWEWPNFRASVHDIVELEEEGGFQSVGSASSCNGDGPGSSRSKSGSKGKGRFGNGGSEALKVTIGPAMLQANFKFKNKDEKK